MPTEHPGEKSPKMPAKEKNVFKMAAIATDSPFYRHDFLANAPRLHLWNI